MFALDMTTRTDRWIARLETAALAFPLALAGFAWFAGTVGGWQLALLAVTGVGFAAVFPHLMAFGDTDDLAEELDIEMEKAIQPDGLAMLPCADCPA